MSNQTDFIKYKLPDVREHIPLAKYTSFKIGGPARYFFEAKNNKDLVKSVQLARDLKIPYFILGEGCNILVSDDGFDGFVIKQANRDIKFYAESNVWVESGVLLQKLIHEAKDKGLSGIEYLIGIPGTIGGAVVGNVGTPNQGEWIEERIKFVEFLDANNQITKIPKNECDFSYRSSRFKKTKNEIILSAAFELTKEKKEGIQDRIKSFLKKRTGQPVNQPCAGSIFKNPDQGKAWQLIDQAGLRGKQIGGAKVSENHTNFIINAGDATAEDVAILISFIKQQVRDKFGVQLQEEIQYIGF